MKNKSHYILALSLICIASSSLAREWTDSKGRSMQADFVRTESSAKGTEVVFKMDSGMHTRVLLTNLSEADQQAIAELKTKSLPAATVAPEVTKTDFELTITKDLVVSKGSRTKRVNQAELASKDYYAIYYSAHWCPPCRGFTPKLVDFYNKASRKHDHFEIIFVSSDRSEKDMAGYMKEADMPWLALGFDKKKTSKALTKFAGDGIPCLVLVDSDGNVLSDSYVNGKYVGPTTVMNDLEERLKNDS
jgi:nucleoredoxin